MIDIDSFVGEVHGYQKQGASYGYTKQLDYHPLVAIRGGSGEVLHIRNRKGKANTQRGNPRFVDELLARVRRAGAANTQRGNPRFVDELLARVRRAGATGTILIRADSGFENHKLFKTLDARGVEFSIGVKQRKPIRALIEEIDEDAWITLADYPEGGEAQIAETKLHGWRLIARRTRLVGKQADLFPNWQYFAFATNRTEPLLLIEAGHRDHAVVELAIRDLKDQALQHFPSGRFAANSAWTVIAALAHNLGRWTSQIGLPHDSTRAAAPQPTVPDPRSTDPHRPAMDTPDARPLALATRLRRRAHTHPRAPRTHLTPPRGTPTPISGPAGNGEQAPARNYRSEPSPTHSRALPRRTSTEPTPPEHRPTPNPPAPRVTPPSYSVDSG